LKDGSRGYAAIEIIVYSILPLMVFALVPAGYQVIQKQLAAESVVRMVAREMMIDKPENPEASAASLANEISSDFGYPASLRISCLENCDEDGGWYLLQVNIDSVQARKVAVIENR